MINSVYIINKDINQPIQFKGLKALYIGYLSCGIVGLMILFASLYIAGINAFICIGVVLIAGTALFIFVHRLSDRYGEHGMMKKMAKRHIPKVVRSYSRNLFLPHHDK